MFTSPMDKLDLNPGKEVKAGERLWSFNDSPRIGISETGSFITPILRG